MIGIGDPKDDIIQELKKKIVCVKVTFWTCSEGKGYGEWFKMDAGLSLNNMIR